MLSFWVLPSAAGLICRYITASSECLRLWRRRWRWHCAQAPKSGRQRRIVIRQGCCCCCYSSCSCFSLVVLVVVVVVVGAVWSSHVPRCFGGCDCRERLSQGACSWELSLLSATATAAPTATATAAAELTWQPRARLTAQFSSSLCSVRNANAKRASLSSSKSSPAIEREKRQHDGKAIITVTVNSNKQQ